MSDSKHSSKKAKIGDLLNRFAAQEEQFLEREFLAPALGRAVVRVRIAGAICQLKVQPANFVGWGIFRPSDFTSAHLVRRATLAQRRAYLDLFTGVRLVVAQRVGEQWLCAAANFGDQRFQIDGLVPVALAEEIQQLDVIQTRFDGGTFWFDEIDARHDPAISVYARSALHEMLPPEELNRSGMSAEIRAAYELNYWQALEQQNQSTPSGQRRWQSSERQLDPVRQRLLEHLSHAGARLIDYLERSDGYSVSYVVDGQRYSSAVAKQDLTVQVAGICLSGQDRKFDLASLVGVLREAGGHIVRVGEANEGIDEEHYWRVHPRP